MRLAQKLLQDVQEYAITIVQKGMVLYCVKDQIFIVLKGDLFMEFFEVKNTAQVINSYIEKEMSMFKKVSDKELSGSAIAPEARAAFNRKPYYNTAGINFKNRPVLR